MKNRLISILLIIHLFLIILGTNLVDFAKVPAFLRSPVGFYLALTGGHSYASFSPDIPTQIVVRCYITDRTGQVLTRTIEKKANTFDLRANYLFQFLDNVSDLETAGKLAADHCFKTYPDAVSVRVSIGRFIVPKITEYKAGRKSNFAELYTNTFDHE